MCRCSYCDADFYDGQEMYKIEGLTLCESCLMDCRTFFNADAEEEPGVDDAVDEWKDAHNGW